MRNCAGAGPERTDSNWPAIALHAQRAQHVAQYRAFEGRIQIEDGAAGQICFTRILRGEADAVEMKALCALTRAGDIGRLHLNANASGSSHHGHQKWDMP